MHCNLSNGRHEKKTLLKVCNISIAPISLNMACIMISITEDERVKAESERGRGDRRERYLSTLNLGVLSTERRRRVI